MVSDETPEVGKARNVEGSEVMKVRSQLAFVWVRSRVDWQTKETVTRRCKSFRQKCTSLHNFT